MRRAADDQLAQIDDSSQECAELSPGDCAYFEDEIEFQPCRSGLPRSAKRKPAEALGPAG